MMSQLELCRIANHSSIHNYSIANYDCWLCINHAHVSTHLVATKFLTNLRTYIVMSYIPYLVTNDIHLITWWNLLSVPLL